jgi:drug/metabolite transporter (DMT)-like permease
MKWLLVALIVASTVAGDLLQSRGMKIAGGPSAPAPGLGRVLSLIASRRDLALAILCMAVSFFAFLALVQTQPISFAVPASAGSFVLETILAKLLLRERVVSRRALGALLVAGGILLVAR